MGSGSWDRETYESTVKDRTSKGKDPFDYSSKTKASGRDIVHDSLKSNRINGKPFGMLESRDNSDHPNSSAIVICLDVTGSNIARAREAQLALPNLMDILHTFMPDAQVAIWANDDPHACVPSVAFQASDFESDIRIETHLTNLLMVGNGGGNDQEGYDMALYCAARKVVMDCLEKRGRKGYLFLYADEKVPTTCLAEDIKGVFGDTIERNIPIQSLLGEARQKFNVWSIWPSGAFTGSSRRDHNVKIFSEDWMLNLQDPKHMCELIAATVGAWEGQLAESDIVKTMVKAGMNTTEAKGIHTALARVYQTRASVIEGALPPSSSEGAERLSA